MTLTSRPSGVEKPDYKVPKEEQLENALEKIRCMCSVPMTDEARIGEHKKLYDIGEIAERALGFERSYHTDNVYLLPSYQR